MSMTLAGSPCTQVPQKAPFCLFSLFFSTFFNFSEIAACPMYVALQAKQSETLQYAN